MNILTPLVLICLQLTQPSKKELEVINKSNLLDSLIINHNVKEADKLYAVNFILTTSSGKKKIRLKCLKI